MFNTDAFPLVDDIIIYMFSDPTLTVESLVGVMEKVTSDKGRRRKVWERVLKLDYMDATLPSYLDEVYLKYSMAEEKTHALADVYVNIRPGSSWQHLVRILYDESELAAAKEAKPFLQQQVGGLCITVNMFTYIVWPEICEGPNFHGGPSLKISLSIFRGWTFRSCSTHNIR